MHRAGGNPGWMILVPLPMDFDTTSGTLQSLAERYNTGEDELLR
jgi:hypothetical protein